MLQFPLPTQLNQIQMIKCKPKENVVSDPNPKHSQDTVALLCLCVLEGESVAFHSTVSNLLVGVAGATSRENPEPV